MIIEITCAILLAWLILITARYWLPVALWMIGLGVGVSLVVLVIVLCVGAYHALV